MPESDREAKLKQDRAMLARMQVGWDYVAAERAADLTEVVTKEAIASLESAFAYTQTLPPRTESGLVAFYAALGRESGRCSVTRINE